MILGYRETFVKQADSSVADEGRLGEMCLPAGLHYPFILPFGKVRIYGDIKTSFLGKVRIKTHRFL